MLLAGGCFVFGAKVGLVAWLCWRRRLVLVSGRRGRRLIAGWLAGHLPGWLVLVLVASAGRVLGARVSGASAAHSWNGPAGR